MKMSARLEEGASAKQAMLYAELCGRTLAHTHAKSGDAALISGYLGKTDEFDQAVGEFAMAYADQNEKDHAALVAAVKAGQIEALIEEDYARGQIDNRRKEGGRYQADNERSQQEYNYERNPEINRRRDDGRYNAQYEPEFSDRQKPKPKTSVKVQNPPGGQSSFIFG